MESGKSRQYWKINQEAGGESLAVPELQFGEILESCDFIGERREGEELQAFMLGIRAGKTIDNFGYQWFVTRFDDFLYIDRIVVSAKFRRNGLATHLYDETLRWCRERGIVRITCQVHDRPSNPTAHALHRQLGFQEIESVMLPSRDIVTMYQRSTAIATP